VVGTGGAISPDRVSQVRERARRAALREAFGTDDPKKIEAIRAEREKEAESIKAEREELARLRTEEETRKRERMSEQEKVQADLEAAREETKKYKAELEQLRSDTAYREQDKQISSIAEKHIDPEMIEFVTDRFARYVQTLPKTKVKRIKPEDVESWFSDFVKKNPKYAKPVDTTGQPPANVVEAKPAKRRVPVRTTRQPIGGKPSAQPVPSAQNTPDRSAGKTVLPGRKDSMTKGELRDHLKSKGLRGW